MAPVFLRSRGFPWRENLVETRVYSDDFTILRNILILFYSRSGVTEALALAIADGARSTGPDVRLRRAREVVSADVMAQAPGWIDQAASMNMRYPAPGLDDIEWADGIIFGTSTRFGNIASELKVFIDALGGLWAQGALTGKTSSAFCTTSARHGTNETTIVSMFLPMLHLGLIIVPSGYGDPAMHRGGTPYGATAVSGKNSTIPGDDDVAAARYQGRRMALVTTALRML